MYKLLHDEEVSMCNRALRIAENSGTCAFGLHICWPVYVIYIVYRLYVLYTYDIHDITLKQ